MKELGTTKGEWQTERTRIISEMLDNPEDYGIYPTTKCFEQLDELYDKATSELLKQRDELLEAMNRIVDPIKYMMLDLRKDESLDGQSALSLSRNVEYLRNIAKAAIKSTER